MAGDWIKVEVGTASKTETLRIAEMLGIDRRQCMGLLVDYWSWLDANARTEFVPNLSRKSLDDVLHCSGLAACLEAVGWAEWDASGWTMRVVNYDHHNGASAKTRAYEQRKKRLQRENMSRFCPVETGTREEKRRDITPIVPTQILPNALPSGFTTFWQTYPTARRNDRAKSLSIWRKHSLEPSAAEITAHLQAMLQTQQWRDGVVPNATTYLNQKRWEAGAPSLADAKKQVAM